MLQRCASGSRVRVTSFQTQCKGSQRQVRCLTAINGASSPTAPTPAETARTLASIVSEGSLSTFHNGTPLGTPVSFTLDSEGLPIVMVAKGSIESQNLAKEPKCSLLVQPSTFPARAVASVTLLGTAEQLAGTSGSTLSYKLKLDHLLYFGGLGSASQAETVDVEQYSTAEPDVLRNVVVDLVNTWNSERAEDIYRILCSYLDTPMMDMQYAELLWVDRLGMYARVQLSGQEEKIVRVPFYRPVLDERDARSVITMAAQLAWERERSYTPAPVSFYADTTAASTASNN